MRVLVACEFSGIVRDAFIARGHDAWSCDLLPPETDGPHFQMDAIQVVNSRTWDLMIAFPPCTHLAVSGARWFKSKKEDQKKALCFVTQLLNAPVPRIALENPISVISTKIRKPDQIIQPWQFGHGETKATCLWLKNLPPLKPTKVVEGRTARVHREPPGPDRWKNRSRTLTGIADAMAMQWGALARKDNDAALADDPRDTHVEQDFVKEPPDACNRQGDYINAAYVRARREALEEAARLVCPDCASGKKPDDGVAHVLDDEDSEVACEAASIHKMLLELARKEGR